MARQTPALPGRGSLKPLSRVTGGRSETKGANQRRRRQLLGPGPAIP